MTQANNVAPLFMNIAKVEHEHHLACQSCALYRLCLPLGLHSDDLAQLDTIIQRSHSISRNQSLFEYLAPFKSIYVVRSGAFKTTVAASNGREQITGFYFPGEFIGMDAIHAQTYQSTAKALETSSICELPFERLSEIGAAMPQLQMQMMSRLSKELSADKNLMLLLGKKTAEEKMATFLVSLSRRFQDRGFSATEFQLSMSRGDIANHLGLAVETVSRLLGRLQDAGVVHFEGKSVTIKDLQSLQSLCG